MLSLLVSSRFQVLFHSPPGVLFTFPSRYYTLSVTWSYLAFWDGPHFFRLDFSCPDVLWIPLRLNRISPTGFSPSLVYFPKIIRLYLNFITLLTRSYNPNSVKLVWALSFSLATTKEIDFSFFSSAYLDVSVQRVALSKAILFTLG